MSQLGRYRSIDLFYLNPLDSGRPVAEDAPSTSPPPTRARTGSTSLDVAIPV